MGPTLPRENEPGPSGCSGGLAIGLVTTFVFVAAHGNLPNVWEHWPGLLFVVLVAAAPFVLLAGLGIGAKLPWLVALGLHLIVWGALSLHVVSLRGEGVIMSMGVLLLACPTVVSAGALAAAKLTGRIPDA